MSGELLALDGETRRRAVSEFATPLMVEAGAGTGKTALLVGRVVAWSLGPGWEREVTDGADPAKVASRVARGVVAITFTEKAAAEMAARLGQALGAVVRGEGYQLACLEATADRAPRAQALLRCLDQFTICTIHAFCRRLLASHPLEAGLHPQFAVDADGLALTQAVRQVMAEFLARVPAELQDAWRRLAVNQVDPASLQELVTALATCGASPEDVLQWPRYKTLQSLRQGISTACTRLCQLLPADGHDRHLRKAWEIRQGLEGLLAGAGDVEALLQGFRRFWRETKPEAKLEQWARGQLTKSEGELLGERAGELAESAAQLRRWAQVVEGCQPAVLAALLRVAAYLLRRSQELLAAQGLVTFHDLLVKAAQLLEEHPEVLQRERGKLHQLLVDEFQDTDRWQARLLQLLALEGSERPGLFVVGDPKQSIYGWRSADLAVYQQFAQWVRQAGGDVLPLVCNFRSVPPILAEVRRLLQPVMVAEPGVQPEYQELVPHRQEGGFRVGPHAPVEHWVSGLEEGEDGRPRLRAGEVRQREADALAAHVEELHCAHQVPYSRMAVLFRALSDVAVYLEAFRRRGIPVVTPRDRSFFQRREVLDAVCLLRAVAEPADQLALVGFLRSPWAGVPDAAWLPLKKRGFFDEVQRLERADPEKLEALARLLREVAAELPADLPGKDRIAGWEESAAWGLAVLAKGRESLRQDPWDVFLANLRRWLLLEASEAARFPGRVRLENLARFFRLLEAHPVEARHGQALWQLLHWATEQTLESAPPVQPEAEEAVLFTSIHQAKGLDFDHVFLADTHRRGRESKGALRVGWVRQGQARVLAFRVGGLVSPNFPDLEEAESKVAQAELVRLLYVAATRARDRLVICSAWGAQGRAGSLAELLHKRLERPELPSLWASLPRDRDRVEAGGALWVFLQRTQREQGEKRVGLSSFPVQEALAQAQAMGQRREWARRYQEKPLVAPASAEAHEELKALWEEEGEGKRAAGVATLAGSVVHRVLQQWDFDRPPAEEKERQLASLRGLLPPETDEKLAQQAVEAAAETLHRFVRAPLFAQFCQLGPLVVAREWPFLLAGDGEVAVGAFVGSIDLVLRRGEEWVVVDFKTDRVTGEELAARVEAYRLQGQRYCHALSAALGTHTPPSFELWFLWAGQRLRLW